METGYTAQFGDGEYHFRLLLPQATELERTCEVSLLDLHQRFEETIGVDLDTGQFTHIAGGPSASAILTVIRLGLIGGNGGLVNGEEIEVGPVRARQLVEAYCWPAAGCSLDEAAALAGAILISEVRGIKLKKKVSQPGEEGSSDSTKASSSATADTSASTGPKRRSARTSKR